MALCTVRSCRRRAALRTSSLPFLPSLVPFSLNLSLFLSRSLRSGFARTHIFVCARISLVTTRRTDILRPSKHRFVPRTAPALSHFHPPPPFSWQRACLVYSFPLFLSPSASLFTSRSASALPSNLFHPSCSSSHLVNLVASQSNPFVFARWRCSHSRLASHNPEPMIVVLSAPAQALMLPAWLFFSHFRSSSFSCASFLFSPPLLLVNRHASLLLSLPSYRIGQGLCIGRLCERPVFLLAKPGPFQWHLSSSAPRRRSARSFGSLLARFSFSFFFSVHCCSVPDALALHVFACRAVDIPALCWGKKENT